MWQIEIHSEAHSLERVMIRIHCCEKTLHLYSIDVHLQFAMGQQILSSIVEIDPRAILVSVRLVYSGRCAMEFVSADSNQSVEIGIGIEIVIVMHYQMTHSQQQVLTR